MCAAVNTPSVEELCKKSAPKRNIRDAREIFSNVLGAQAFKNHKRRSFDDLQQILLDVNLSASQKDKITEELFKGYDRTMNKKSICKKSNSTKSNCSPGFSWHCVPDALHAKMVLRLVKYGGKRSLDNNLGEDIEHFCTLIDDIDEEVNGNKK